MSHHFINSSDVTLASSDAKNKQSVCKFHQSGHCKFGVNCRHMHSDTTCTNSSCDRKSCLSRHPWPCKYYISYGYCKFESHCSFFHPESKSKNLEEEIETLKISFQNMLKCLADKEIEIRTLQEKVNNLEGMSKCQYLCKQCDKVFKSNVTLHKHMKKYHKQEVPGECDDNIETLRESENKNSVNLSSLCSTRSILSSTSSQESNVSKADAECEQCGEVLLADDMDAHDWYFHRETTCSFSDQGSNCTTYPSEIQMAYNIWTISCDNCWKEMLEKCPGYGTFGPCEASEGFK